MEETGKRLFFGLEIKAPWPKNWGSGRILLEKDRHLTLAFLGAVESKELLQTLSSPPLPSFRFAPIGVFDRCLFLPKRFPRVVAWHTQFFEGEELLTEYHEILSGWLCDIGIVIEKRSFLPHVTIARSPLQLEFWKESFQKLPFFCNALHLYESLDCSQYRTRWSHFFTLPFEEILHTADIAFIVRGNTIADINLHAEFALAFTYPELLPYLQKSDAKSLDEVIISLNELVLRVDSEIGCPFKAVSFHGDIIAKEDVLTWEMIVDV